MVVAFRMHLKLFFLHYLINRRNNTHMLCTLLVSQAWSPARSLARPVLSFDGHWMEYSLRMSTGKSLWLPESDHWEGACNCRKKKTANWTSCQNHHAIAGALLNAKGSWISFLCLIVFLNYCSASFKSLLSSIFFPIDFYTFGEEKIEKSQSTREKWVCD